MLVRRCRDGALGCEHGGDLRGDSPTWRCDVGSAARSLDRKEIRSGPDRPKHSPFSPHSPEWAPRSGSIGECGERREWFSRVSLSSSYLERGLTGLGGANTMSAIEALRMAYAASVDIS